MSTGEVTWCRTRDGWAVNLDGTSAALVFALPRIELRAGPRGWDCTCHLADGTSLRIPLGRAPTLAAAQRAAEEGARAALTRRGVRAGT